MRTFTASDLSRRRKAVLAASSAEGALVRNTTGETLAFVRFERLAAAERIGELASVLTALIGSLEMEDVNSSMLGEVAWAASWSRERRRQLVADLAEALALSISLNDPVPAEALLEGSKPKPASDDRFDAAAVWAALTEEDREFLQRTSRDRQAKTTEP